MNKRTWISFIPALLLTTATVHCQTASKGVVPMILSSYETMQFTSEPVTEGQLEQILMCGIKAPSGRNLQPWKFTAVRDVALMQSIVKNTPEGNVLIIVSGQDPQQGGAAPDLECGLAAGYMYVAAMGLGLGAHIYGSPVGNINKSMKETLGIPQGYSAIVVVRIGHPDMDAVSSASTRNQINEVVNYK